MVCVRCQRQDVRYSTVCAECARGFSPAQHDARLARFHAKRLATATILDEAGRTLARSAEVLVELDRRALAGRPGAVAPAAAETTAEAREPAPPAEATRPCPFCAEPILAAAIRCKHCRSDLGAVADGGQAAASLAPPAPAMVAGKPAGWPGLVTAMALLVAVTGMVRIYHGGPLGLRIVPKRTFGFHDTIVDLDVLLPMPAIVVAAQHPEVKRQLIDLGVIESDAARAARIEQEVAATMQKAEREGEAMARRFMRDAEAHQAESARAMKLISKEATRDDFGGTVEGIAENTANHGLNYVTVEFQAFDAAGNQIGTAMDTTTNLAAGAKWRYKAIYFGSSDVRTFKFSGFTAN